MRAALLAVMLVVSLVLAGCVSDDQSELSKEAQKRGACVSSLDTETEAAEPTWIMNTNMGTMRFALFCDKTPITAQNIVTLTEDGYFDGIKFHRVWEGFMNQGGDPLSKDDSKSASWGTGGPGYAIKDEFYCADGSVSHTHPASCPSGLGLTHDKAGILSMANSGPASGGSQFFITAVPTPHLDGKHPVFGEVADQESLEVALAINQVETGGPRGTTPVDPVIIESATIEWA